MATSPPNQNLIRLESEASSNVDAPPRPMQKFLSRRHWMMLCLASSTLHRELFADTFQSPPLPDSSQSLADLHHGHIDELLLAGPACLALRAWLKNQIELAPRRSRSQTLLIALKSLFVKPTDHRHRFVLPRFQPLAQTSKQAWTEAFPNQDSQAEFTRLLTDYLADVSHKLDSPVASRVPLQLASLATLLPSDANPVQYLRDHPTLQAIQSVRRGSTQSRGSHPVTGWPASNYQLVQTTHFEIAFQGRGRPNLEVAEMCEHTFAIWSLLFQSTPYSPSQSIPPIVSPSALPSAPLQVLVFSSKENYLKAIEKNIDNASASVGFYDPQLRASLIYIEPKKSYATLVHELTHQFFNEVSSQSIEFDPNHSQGFWLAEGVALYMESLSTSEIGSVRLIDVGGWDASRLQASRFRMLYEGMWFPWPEFSSADGLRFRDPRDLAPRYSQAAGVAHYLFESTSANQQSTHKQLDALYHDRRRKLTNVLSDDRLMRAYIAFLQSPSISSADYLPFSNRNELILPRCKFEHEALVQVLASRSDWEAIDLAYTDCDDRLIEELPPDFATKRFNLESTKITDRSLSIIGKIAQVRELDLSQCAVSDQGMEALANHPSLNTLWIVGTEIDDRAIDAIASIKGLNTLHAKGCKITQAGWEELVRRQPRLKKNSTPPV